MMRRAAIVLAGTALLAASLMVVPRGIAAAGYLAGPRDEIATADYALRGMGSQDVESAISQAIASRDDELAASLVALAHSLRIPISATVSEEIERSAAEAEGRRWSDAWQGFASGDSFNEAALSGAIAADLVGYGDLRDLHEQALRYGDGLEVDGLTVGFAAVGVALTAATIASFGSTSPAKAGVSTLKATRRAGKLTPALAREVATLATDAVDGQAFRALATSARTLDLTAFRTAASRLVRPQALERIGVLGRDVTEIGTTLGYRGTLQSLGMARNADEIGSIARLSKSFGARTRGVLALLGGAALTAASFTVTAAAWAFTALLWGAAALLFVTRVVWKLVRWLAATGNKQIQHGARA